MNTPHVSRAYEKLNFALSTFKVSVEGLTCADFGSSTGGFVECLLDNKAYKVYSVDTSYGELAWKLRNDSRVVVLERTNALYVALPELVDFISIDVSWTRQEKVLPTASKNLKKGGFIISLLKPHYEVEPKFLKKGVLEESILPSILEELKSKILTIPDLKLNGVIESPILGSKGKNREFLLFISKE